MSEPGFKILVKETYLRAIENSVGSKLFNSVFVEDFGTKQTIDILNNGELSCAFFVSCILTLSKMIGAPHTTVDSIFKIMSHSDDWTEVKSDLKPGDVVFWDKIRETDGVEHGHVGFVLNKNEAVSTSSNEHLVVRHHLTFGINHDTPVRNFTKIFRYTKFIY